MIFGMICSMASWFATWFYFFLFVDRQKPAERLALLWMLVPHSIARYPPSSLHLFNNLLKRICDVSSFLGPVQRAITHIRQHWFLNIKTTNITLWSMMYCCKMVVLFLDLYYLYQSLIFLDTQASEHSRQQNVTPWALLKKNSDLSSRRKNKWTEKVFGGDSFSHCCKIWFYSRDKQSRLSMKNTVS